MELFRKIEREYQELRDADEKAHRKKMAKLYRNLPELEALDQKIQRLGIEGAKEQLLHPNSKGLSEINEALYTLREEKAHLLMTMGLPRDYTKVDYRCELCEDTGRLEDGSRCRCFKQRISRELYEMSNLNLQLEKENFLTFDLGIFSKDVYDGENLSPRDNMEAILRVVRRFIDDFEKNNDFNMLFYGTTGQGKTFMLNCIAKELLDKNVNVIYQTAFNIVDIVEDRRFRRNEATQMKYELLLNSDLLIIDDLGIERINAFSTSEIFNIVNSRLLSGKKTLISTNLSPKELSSTYTDRVFSRVFQKFMPLKFYGEDLRLR
ncbi:ATP-binding protein [Peptoniphilus equinus]|uniref:ATP-binding protein n=1 Tax=Peptoniphilus equinus TaxID=3016343 RepID=A0ABY7QT94_9FIRM|nr:ATP-binding protein [Peptoniphilus equinus]WBW50013.1 ATP-binding protein [Peptoniphilus equinus]